MKLEDWIKSLSKSTAKEITELRALRTELAAWHTQFGTTQLSHALAERDRLRREKAELAAAYRHFHTYCGDEDCQACHLVGTALRDVLAETEAFLTELAHMDVLMVGPRLFKSGKTIQAAAREELARLRAAIGERQ